MVIDADVLTELRRARTRAGFMLTVTIIGMVMFDSMPVFVVLALNAVVWLVQFWYYAGQIYEHTLVESDRLHRGDK